MVASGPLAAPLVTTKLVPPTRAGALVERPALHARLARAAQRRLALVSAPAGSGKTSVLAHAWKATRDAGGEAAWLSLDPEDNDHARFLAYVIEAPANTEVRIRNSSGDVAIRNVEGPLNIDTSSGNGKIFPHVARLVLRCWTRWVF